MPSIGRSCQVFTSRASDNLHGLVHLSRSCVLPELSASNSSTKNRLTLGSDVFYFGSLV
jgi:hypothetical protein